MNIRRGIATVGAAGALVTGSLVLAGPAQAAPVVTGGLVNVTIVDLITLEDVVVQLPIAVAANVCDVNVNVLARQLRTGDAACTAVADPDAQA